MGREVCVRVTCDSCGKTHDCLPEDLKRNGPEGKYRDTEVPVGWLLVWAMVRDVWSGEFPRDTFFRPKPSADEDMDAFHALHACSRSCAVSLLHKLSSILVAG
jgi:hypothetical protein